MTIPKSDSHFKFKLRLRWKSPITVGLALIALATIAAFIAYMTVDLFSELEYATTRYRIGKCVAADAIGKEYDCFGHIHEVFSLLRAAMSVLLSFPIAVVLSIVAKERYSDRTVEGIRDYKMMDKWSKAITLVGLIAATMFIVLYFGVIRFDLLT